MTFQPEDITEANKLGRNITVDSIKNVLLCGMGGSAIAGKIIKDYLEEELKIPFLVNSGYKLPAFVDNSTLVFIVSYSGNTEEILACYEEAKNRNAKIITITSGGKLKNENSIIVPEGFMPRNSFPYLFFPILNVLINNNLVSEKNEDIEEVKGILLDFDKEKAKLLAEKINGKFPVIYSSSKFSSLVYRWQTQLNENSKILAHCHVFPELNHNEIEARHQSTIILLRTEKDIEKKQMDAAQELLKAEEVYLQGTSFLANIFYGIYLGDHVSEYLAEFNNINSKVTERIDYIKKKL